MRFKRRGEGDWRMEANVGIMEFGLSAQLRGTRVRHKAWRGKHDIVGMCHEDGLSRIISHKQHTIYTRNKKMVMR
jgi:hypothetical protein